MPTKRKVVGSKKAIGVIVARFQVAELHPGHIHLISHVLERHEEVAIVLGTRGGMRTPRDPLTFEERVEMIKQSLPEQHFTILQLSDHPESSEKWARSLDALIETAFPGRAAILYGARDSFIPHYLTKKFPTREVKPVHSYSGTEVRKALKFSHTKEGRTAIIHLMEHRPPLVYATSDLAIVDKTNESVLLIGKNIHEGKLSFVGGFADKKDGTALCTAQREGMEEALGVGFGPLEYVDSVVIDDPRYRGTSDGVMTTFFMTGYRGGTPFPGDDADFIRWVPYRELIESLVPWHRPLGELLLRKLGITQSS